MNELKWFVAHTLPRREKKLQKYCERESVLVTLPMYNTVHKYRGKIVSFQKPLFPSYVFLQLLPNQKQQFVQHDCVANLLVVHDQELFRSQLAVILEALGTGLEIHLAPEIGPGKRVKIKSGALRGLEGWVEERHGPMTVLLRLDFIGQAAAVKLDADHLELS